MNYEKIAEIIENEIDNRKNPLLNVSTNDILKLNKRILDKIADLFKEKKYKIISNNDGNDQIELNSNEVLDAYEEALDLLGYSLFIDED